MKKKKILYFSDSKFPLAGLAGAIHTGLLPAGKLPDKTRFWKLPFLNLKNVEGRIIPLGNDPAGNSVFALSVKGERGMVHRLVESMLAIYNIPQEEIALVDSEVSDNMYLMAGGTLCRSSFFAPVGQLIAMAGLRKIYERLTQWAADVKSTY